MNIFDGVKFNNSFAKLSEEFYTKQKWSSFEKAHLISFNKDLAKTAKNSSIIGIFGIIQIPILHFSVIWWRSVHQQASILSQETVASGDAPMSSDILITLLLSVLLVTLVHTFLTKRFRISNDISWDNYLNPKSRAKI